MNRPLHILHVTKSTGGVAAYVRGLVNGLDRQQFRFSVVCLSEGGPAFAAELNRLPNVQAFSVAMNRYNIAPLSDSRAWVQIMRLMRSEAYDAVHAHASKPGFLARLAALGSGIPVIYAPHCFAFHDGAGRFKAAVIASMERLAARYLTTCILTVCAEERIWALQHRIGTATSVVAIPTGIDIQPFDQPVDRARLRADLGVPPDVPLIGAVGRLNAQKSPLDFVQAAARVHTNRPDVHFVWIGSGPLAAEADALVEQLKLDTVFHFAGQRTNVPELLHVFDGFVLSSHWEGFSLSVLEAMAARLPVVATRVMGVAEAVSEGHNGLIVPPGQPDALGQAILELVSDPERARQMGVIGRQRIEQEFTRNRMIEQIAQMYHDLAHFDAGMQEVGATGQPPLP